MSSTHVVPMFDLNPLQWLGNAAKEGVADGFTAMMMSLWSAALWLLRAVFSLLDRFVTPQLDDPGLTRLYGIAVGLSLVVALVIAFGQLALLAVRRDGRHLATLVAGLGQYGLVLAVWVGAGAALVTGCAGLSRVLLEELLQVDSFSGYAAGAGWVDHVSGTVESAVLGMCGLLLLIPAAVGYLLIMLAREAALLVLVATMPIAAAGALGESTRVWMWKSVRWFLAASLTAPLLALVLGLGVQISQAGMPAGARTAASSAVRTTADHGESGAVTTQGDVEDTPANIGLAVVGCVVTLVGCFCPMALFRLLAFVDPGTGSGAAFRSTLQANGGVAGVLGRSGSAPSGSTAAQAVDVHGQAVGEAAAEGETATRYSKKLAAVLPAAGRAVGGAVGAVGHAAGRGAALGVDVMGQSGVGHQGFYDTGAARGPATSRPPRPPQAQSAPSHNRPGSAVPDVTPPGPSPAAGSAVTAEDAALLA